MGVWGLRLGRGRSRWRRDFRFFVIISHLFRGGGGGESESWCLRFKASGPKGSGPTGFSPPKPETLKSSPQSLGSRERGRQGHLDPGSGGASVHYMYLGPKEPASLGVSMTSLYKSFKRVGYLGLR